MPRSLLALVGLLVAVLALAACSNDEAVKTVVTPTTSESVRPSKETVGAFVKRHLEYEVKGEWGRDWDVLHPLHQGVITRSQYVYCREGELNYKGNETVRVEETYDNPIDVPGIPPARIMRASVEILSPGQRAGSTFTDHAVKVKGAWRWILDGTEVDYYARGKCRDGTKLPNASG
jgi:hypothetical protein